MLLTLREEQSFRVFESRVLRRIFGPKREEVARGWRKLRNEEIHKLYASSNIIIMIKSRRMRLTVHVARIGEMRIIFWLENLKGRDQLEDLGVNGKITLEWILGKYRGRLWAGYFWLRIRTSGELL
jgi:hypothetical protein